MCDTTQFVVIVSVPDETLVTLADNFMHHVLFYFGICHIVMLEDSSHFKGVFFEIFKALNINFDILVKINHKSLIIKNHRFINRSITISTKGRGTDEVFVTINITAECTYNISPIDGIDILRSVPAIG